MALRNEYDLTCTGVCAIALSDVSRRQRRAIEQIRVRAATLWKSGPFLFGTFGAADAMFAPVVHRFRTAGSRSAPSAPTWTR
jgi:glutathione S-transferase